ncbi:MAG: arylesterase [Litoreibacter sp.]
MSLTTWANANEITIAALGDSLTQGYGLPERDGFVPQLEMWLETHGADVAVINAGVSGDTTAGGAARIGWTLSPDVDALIVTLGGNDILRGIDPAVARENLDIVLREATAQGIPVLLSGMKAPANYGREYQTRFNAIYPELAQAYGVLLYPDFLKPITAGISRQAALQNLMQPDGIHPNAQGVALVVDGIGPSVLKLSEQIAK